MIQIQDTIPAISWRELETILQGMATTETKRRMIRHLMEGTRKQAVFLSAGGVMTEIIYIAAAMLDVNFSPEIANMGGSEASFSSSASPPQSSGS